MLRSPERAMLVGVHDRAEASALADRLLIMIDGSLVVDGPPRELFESPPSAAVARFLGYDGELSYNDGLLLTRRSHVRLDPAGRLTARVVRTIPREDGARVELECETGRVFAFVGTRRTRADDDVRLSIDGGARF